MKFVLGSASDHFVARLSLWERRVDLADITLAPVTIFTDS